ncbi:hypothetical protein YC2023_076367 [Brassica napus]
MLPKATDPTKIVVLMEPIPTENFRFPKYEQLKVLENTNVNFPDVFGDVCDIKTTYNDETHAIQRVVVTVLIDRSHVKHLPTLQKYDRAFLECYLGMHFYFDNECIAGKSLLGANSTSSYLGVQTIESVAFAELKTYVLNSPPQAAEFFLHPRFTSYAYQKLQREFTSFTCTCCNVDNVDGVVRYCT